MRKVSIFKNGKNQAVRLPKDMEFQNVSELEVIRQGNSIILRPVRPSWTSFAEHPKAADDFLQDRPAIITDEGRVKL